MNLVDVKEMGMDCKFQSQAATCIAIYRECRCQHFLKTCPYDTYEDCNFGLPREIVRN